MKVNRNFIILFIIFFFMWSCSKSSIENRPEDVLRSLSNATSYMEKRRFYSSGTQGVLSNAFAKGQVDERDKNRLPYDLDESIEWEMVKSEILSKGFEKKARVIIKYIEHPIENMIGFKMVYNFIVENGKWKIDLKEELERALIFVDKNDSNKYLNEIKSKKTIR